MDTLHVKVYSHDEYKKENSTNLIFEITNHSKRPVRILKWNTPLEGLKTDCLDVRKNGKAVLYDGILVKRSAPTEDDFITIPPGKSVSNKVDISEAYDLTSPGQVMVDYKKQGLRAMTSAIQRKVSPENLIATLKKPGKAIKVVTKKAAFKIVGGAKRLPIGATMRSAQPLKKTVLLKKALAAVAGPYPCLLKGGTAAEKQAAKKAHSNGYKLVNDLLNSMKNGKDYKTWFGAYAKSRFKKVKSDYLKIQSEYETKQFTYDLTIGSACGPNDFAYTTKGGDTIWLCNAFRTAPDNGTDSQAGTIVHERSHASAYTDDIAYGQNDCKALGKTSPKQAINNADTHEYYAKG